MKTAISLPNRLFVVAEKYAKTHGLSRSELYATALDEFIQKDENITEGINAVCETVDTSLNLQIKIASKRVLLNSEW